MENIDWNVYFKGDNKDYDTKYLRTILESLLDNSIEDIRKNVNNCDIKVTEEQIKEYLNNKLEEENPELKKRRETSKNRNWINLSKCTQKDIEESSQNFIDELDMVRYTYEPYTLHYYSHYIMILKSKINKLLYVIDGISSNNASQIEEELNNLDINIIDNKILKSDIIRLIIPTIYNIETLKSKTNEANNLDTYLTNKLSKHYLLRRGIFEYEIYPSKSIIMNHLDYDGIPGYVKLTEKQKKKLREKMDKRIKNNANFIIDMF